MAHWSTPLPHPITLKDGRVLVTLRDAGELLVNGFKNTTRSQGLDEARRLVLEAAETGDAQDLATAADVLERQLQVRRMM